MLGCVGARSIQCCVYASTNQCCVGARTNQCCVYARTNQCCVNRRQVINSVYLLRRRIKLLAPHSGGVVERKNNGKKEMETLLASARFGRNLRKSFGKKNTKMNLKHMMDYRMIVQ